MTAGDAPGFPVTLSQPGSYRLMSNLTVTDPNTYAITITVPNVRWHGGAAMPAAYGRNVFAANASEAVAGNATKFEDNVCDGGVC